MGSIASHVLMSAVEARELGVIDSNAWFDSRWVQCELKFSSWNGHGPRHRFPTDGYETSTTGVRRLVNGYGSTGTILGMGSANERRRYNITSSHTDWTHTQNYLPIRWMLEHVDI